MSGRRGTRRLLDAVREAAPEIDADRAIAAGEVLVDGLPVSNPRSMVRKGASLQHRPPAPLRGQAKLGTALELFGVRPEGRVALDVGASTGGFTTVLLERGAPRVYAVDAGHGQLLGRLRQDARVVNLEATNLSRLDLDLVPEAIELLTVDVSYLSLGAAVAQLTGRLRLAPGALLLGLVKPMFELRLGEAPTDPLRLRRATQLAEAAIAAAGWGVVATAGSPLPGAGGALEGWVHARHPGSAGPAGEPRLP